MKCIGFLKNIIKNIKTLIEITNKQLKYLYKLILERILSVNKTEIKLYYNNVMTDVIGNDHGITEEQLADLAQKVQPLIPKIMDEIIGHKTPPKTPTMYGSLLTRDDIAKEVKKLVKKLKKGA